MKTFFLQLFKHSLNVLVGREFLDTGLDLVNLIDRYTDAIWKTIEDNIAERAKRVANRRRQRRATASR